MVMVFSMMVIIGGYIVIILALAARPKTVMTAAPTIQIPLRKFNLVDTEKPHIAARLR